MSCASADRTIRICRRQHRSRRVAALALEPSASSSFSGMRKEVHGFLAAGFLVALAVHERGLLLPLEALPLEAGVLPVVQQLPVALRELTGVLAAERSE